MVYKVILSNRALDDVNQIVTYLLKNWTIREANSFLDKLKQLKKIISSDPSIFSYYDKERKIHKAVLTKHNIVFYKVDLLVKAVQIITIFNVYQDPEKLKVGFKNHQNS